jgi:vacuolar-type H+-ATPase subunit D/Vma8
VAGVQLPVFEMLNHAGEGDLVGMSKGGQRITQCRKTFVHTLELLIRLASLQVHLTQISPLFAAVVTRTPMCRPLL